MQKCPYYLLIYMQSVLIYMQTAGGGCGGVVEHVAPARLHPLRHRPGGGHLGAQVLGRARAALDPDRGGVIAERRLGGRALPGDQEVHRRVQPRPRIVNTTVSGPCILLENPQ